MNAKNLTLNIAVNLERIGRWSAEGRSARVNQFLTETEGFLKELEKAEKTDKFQRTFIKFKEDFRRLKNDIQLNEDWSERFYTWGNILTHRSKLLD